MTLSETEILQILKLVDESSFGELQLEIGDVRLVARKQGCVASVKPRLEPVPVRAQPSPPPAAQDAALSSARAQSKKEQSQEVPQISQDAVPIKAPILGTFYRRASPDAPPYVEVGSFVNEDDTICLIEVMKVFTAVKAEIRGHIREILVENNSMVEYGQPMFLVKPEAASSGISA